MERRPRDTLRAQRVQKAHIAEMNQSLVALPRRRGRPPRRIGRIGHIYELRKKRDGRKNQDKGS